MTVKSKNCRKKKGDSDEYHKEASDRRSNYSSKGGGVSLILRSEERVKKVISCYFRSKLSCVRSSVRRFHED